jgi:hypothetical protein
MPWCQMSLRVTTWLWMVHRLLFCDRCVVRDMAREMGVVPIHTCWC